MEKKKVRVLALVLLLAMLLNSITVLADVGPGEEEAKKNIIVRLQSEDKKGVLSKITEESLSFTGNLRDTIKYELRLDQRQIYYSEEAEGSQELKTELEGVKTSKKYYITKEAIDQQYPGTGFYTLENLDQSGQILNFYFKINTEIYGENIQSMDEINIVVKFNDYYQAPTTSNEEYFSKNNQDLEVQFLYFKDSSSLDRGETKRIEDIKILNSKNDNYSKLEEYLKGKEFPIKKSKDGHNFKLAGYRLGKDNNIYISEDEYDFIELIGLDRYVFLQEYSQGKLDRYSEESGNPENLNYPIEYGYNQGKLSFTINPDGLEAIKDTNVSTKTHKFLEKNAGKIELIGLEVSEVEEATKGQVLEYVRINKEGSNSISNYLRGIYDLDGLLSKIEGDKGDKETKLSENKRILEDLKVDLSGVINNFNSSYDGAYYTAKLESPAQGRMGIRSFSMSIDAESDESYKNSQESRLEIIRGYFGNKFLENLEEDLGDLKTRIKNMGSQDNVNELKTAKEELKELEKSIEELGGSIEELGGSIEALEKSIEELGGSIEELEKSIEELEKSIASDTTSESDKIILREEKTNLENQLGQKNIEKINLNNQLEQKNIEKINLNNQLEQKNIEKINLIETIKSLKTPNLEDYPNPEGKTKRIEKEKESILDFMPAYMEVLVLEENFGKSEKKMEIEFLLEFLENVIGRMEAYKVKKDEYDLSAKNRSLMETKEEITNISKNLTSAKESLLDKANRITEKNFGLRENSLGNIETITEDKIILAEASAETTKPSLGEINNFRNGLRIFNTEGGAEPYILKSWSKDGSVSNMANFGAELSDINDDLDGYESKVGDSLESIKDTSTTIKAGDLRSGLEFKLLYVIRDELPEETEAPSEEAVYKYFKLPWINIKDVEEGFTEYEEINIKHISGLYSKGKQDLGGYSGNDEFKYGAYYMFNKNLTWDGKTPSDDSSTKLRIPRNSNLLITEESLEKIEESEAFAGAKKLGLKLAYIKIGDELVWRSDLGPAINKEGQLYKIEDGQLTIYAKEENKLGEIFINMVEDLEQNLEGQTTKEGIKTQLEDFVAQLEGMKDETTKEKVENLIGSLKAEEIESFKNGLDEIEDTAMEASLAVVIDNLRGQIKAFKNSTGQMTSIDLVFEDELNEEYFIYYKNSAGNQDILEPVRINRIKGTEVIVKAPNIIEESIEDDEGNKLLKKYKLRSISPEYKAGYAKLGENDRQITFSYAEYSGDEEVSQYIPGYKDDKKIQGDVDTEVSEKNIQSKLGESSGNSPFVKLNFELRQVNLCNKAGCNIQNHKLPIAGDKLYGFFNSQSYISREGKTIIDLKAHMNKTPGIPYAYSIETSNKSGKNVVLEFKDLQGASFSKTNSKIELDMAKLDLNSKNDVFINIYYKRYYSHTPDWTNKTGIITHEYLDDLQEKPEKYKFELIERENYSGSLRISVVNDIYKYWDMFNIEQSHGEVESPTRDKAINRLEFVSIDKLKNSSAEKIILIDKPEDWEAGRLVTQGDIDTLGIESKFKVNIKGKMGDGYKVKLIDFKEKNSWKDFRYELMPGKEEHFNFEYYFKDGTKIPPIEREKIGFLETKVYLYKDDEWETIANYGKDIDLILERVKIEDSKLDFQGTNEYKNTYEYLKSNPATEYLELNKGETIYTIEHYYYDKNTHTQIAYHANGGSFGPGKPGDVTDGEKRTIVAKKGELVEGYHPDDISRSSHRFLGWAKKDGDGKFSLIDKEVNEDGSIKQEKVAEGLELYAQWEEIVAPPTEPGGGGSGGGGGGGNDRDPKPKPPVEELPKDPVSPPTIDTSVPGAGGRDSRGRTIGEILEPMIEYELNKTDHLAYIKGYPGEVVKPDGNISREEVAMVFYRLMEPEFRDEIKTQDHSFKDLKDNHWSNQAIASLANGGLMLGYGDGTFRGQNKISRAEVSKLIARFTDTIVLETEMPDVIGHWAEDYINTARYRGWIKGYEDGSFKPNDSLSRAEFVTMMNSLLDRKVRKENILPGIKSFRDLPEKWYYEAMVEAINGHDYEGERLEDGSEKWIKLVDTQYPD